jgi:hypothetical protein
MKPFKESTNQVSPGHDEGNSPSTKEDRVSTKAPELPRTAFMCFMAQRAQLLQDNKASSTEVTCTYHSLYFINFSYGKKLIVCFSYCSLKIFCR